MRDAERIIAEQRRSAETGQRQVEAARVDLQKERNSAQRDEAKLQQLEGKLVAREAELARQRREVSAKEDARKALDRELAELRDAARTAAAGKLADVAAAPRIEIIDPPVPQTRSADAPPVLTVRGLGDRVIVGKVTAPGGLLALLVNDREV